MRIRPWVDYYPLCVDLAKGHAAVLPLFEKGFTGAKVYNLGTGKGYSVLDMIHAFSKAAGKDIPYVIDPRRPGDIPECYADCSKAYEELGWKAEEDSGRHVRRLPALAKDEPQWL